MKKMGNIMANQSSYSQVEVEGNYLNGLVLKSYHLPEEIIGEILGKLPETDILRCRLVCKRWRDIVTYLLYNIYNKTFNTHHTSESLPFDLCYITLFSERLRKNLLRNVNGEEKLKYWKITDNGGDGLIIEDVPSGSNTLPEGIDEFNGHSSCFASSFYPCVKEQRINIAKDKYLSHIINVYKPHIYASEWVAGRFDCGARYQMCIKVLCKNQKQVEKSVTHQIVQWEGSEWTKKDIVIDTYPDNVEEIVFQHLAVDTQFWKGHYGMKMAGAVVKVLLNKVKILK